MFDLDHFKAVNDTCGHQAGDRVLRAFADTVRGALRPNDLFGRYGGEEFTVVLPGATIETAYVIAERRTQLGEWTHEKTWGSDDPRLWGAIGRVGARVPVYASVHHVVPAKTAEAWLTHLLKLKWESVATAPHA